MDALARIPVLTCFLLALVIKLWRDATGSTLIAFRARPSNNEQWHLSHGLLHLLIVGDTILSTRASRYYTPVGDAKGRASTTRGIASEAIGSAHLGSAHFKTSGDFFSDKANRDKRTIV